MDADHRHTIADLLAHPDRKHLELVDGRLIERELGARGSAASSDVMKVLSNFECAERRGWLFAPTLAYRCFVDPDRVRHVSWSYIRRSRLPVLGREFFSTTVPDLIVEVTPPYLNPDEVPARIDDFLAAGTPLAWIVNYEKQIVLVRQPCKQHEVLRETDTLTGGDLLPGFTVKIADLFPKA
jgi:Uma2 family endonuclease